MDPAGRSSGRSPGLTLGIPTYGRWAAGGARRLLDVARAAEDHGAGRISVTDHVVMGRDTTEYPFGSFPVPPDAPWLEPLTFLTAVAASTESIRLETRVLIAPLRPAALLAKTVATLDQLSGGRVDLGVGTGWLRDEFSALGLDVERRGEMLTDTIAACRELWTSSPSTFESATVSFDGVTCHPRPLQTRLPVWIGGNVHRRSIDRIGRLGDGWIPPAGATPDLVRSGVQRLTAELDGLPDGFTVQVSLAPDPRDGARHGSGRDIADVVDQVPAFIEAGVTDAVVDLGLFADNPDEADRTIKELVRRFDDARF